MGVFFINRPVLAWVLAIVIMLAGAISIPFLPVSQYPDVALPQISIFGQYPGASAKVVDQSVTQVIEQQMKGIDNLLFMSSSSDSFGNIEIYFTFAAGTDSDIAQVQVQNKLQQALPQLPEPVQKQRLQVTRAVENSFMTIVFYSRDDSMVASQISDYVASNVLNDLGRLKGVGSVTLYGGSNAMRIWCNPEKMRQYKLNPQDIIEAVRSQNEQVPGGQAGAVPIQAGQQVNFVINASSLLETAEEFSAISIRSRTDGSILRLKDVARVELNEENFLGQSWYNGYPGIGLSLKLASGANVLETTNAVKEELRYLSRFFPASLEYAYIDDRAPLVKKSVLAVSRTLVEAIVLVVIVMFLFLQNWRATVIPAIAIPVVLLGVFAIMAVAGYSINTLTMFGMALAIGLLVDDAVLVVENTERLMSREGLSAPEAVKASMRQITATLVAVAIILSVVFIPMAFMPGSIGIILRQFSITIVSAMILSVLVAVVFTPALCAEIMQPHIRPGYGSLGSFNRLAQRLTYFYVYSAWKILHRPGTMVIFFAFIVSGCILLFFHLPAAFLPDEDQGILYVDIQLPPGASFERTQEVIKEVENYLNAAEKDSISSIFSVMGWGFSSSGQASAMIFANLKDWSERGKGQEAKAIKKRAVKYFANKHEADIAVMTPPAIMELGNSANFELEIMDRSGKGHEALMEVKDFIIEQAEKNPVISDARFSGMEDTEQYDLLIDRDTIRVLGLDNSIINTAIAAYWAGEYINDFMDQGRIKKVIFQAEPSFRSRPEDFFRYYIRNDKGNMVPFSAFLKVASTVASPRLTRYNGVPSVRIEGTPAHGKSSGEAIATMNKIAKTLPPGFDTAWTGLSYQEILSGNQAQMLYVISVIAIFLCLAALYESWRLPCIILLSLPAGIIGVLGGASLFGLNNDAYLQIALLAVTGLSAKNSIFILEFAIRLNKAGKNLTDAIIEALTLRLRPIIMTSICFIGGVIPLALSSGAGAGAQNAIGVTICFGTLSATLLGLYYTPFFFVFIMKLFRCSAP